MRGRDHFTNLGVTVGGAPGTFSKGESGGGEEKKRRRSSVNDVQNRRSGDIHSVLAANRGKSKVGRKEKRGGETAQLKEANPTNPKTEGVERKEGKQGER